MRVCSIASGSSGNCTYVGSGDTNILIDAGVSRKRIVEGLKKISVAPEQLDGIFVTHEHSDHIQGINMMVKMFDTPVYATGGTLDAIRLKDKKGIISMNHLFEVHADEPVSMGAITVMPFSTSHDAADPVGYTFGRELDRESLYYERFITHLKHFLARVVKNETYGEDANDRLAIMVKDEFPKSYRCALRIRDYLKVSRKYNVSLEEISYLTIHIQRLSGEGQKNIHKES